MKISLKSLAVFAAALTTSAHAAAIAQVSFSGGDSTFIFSDISGTPSDTGTSFFYVNINPSGAFTFNNAAVTIGGASNASALTANTVTSVATWIGDGSGAVPLGQLDGIQLRFSSAANYAGTFEFTIPGQDYSALNGASFSVAQIQGASAISQIPEPTSGALLGLGALSLLARRKRG